MPIWRPGIRAKLIIIFVLIKVLPLVALAWFSYAQIQELGSSVETRAEKMVADTRDVVAEVGKLSSENSIKALDVKSREAIERLTTDTARAVAAFLEDRDKDIRLASLIEPSAAAYREFLETRTGDVILHQPWVLSEDGAAWEPSEAVPGGPTVRSTNRDNDKDFHSRPPDNFWRVEERPLYLEMTFVGPDGRELVKVTTSDMLRPELQDVSKSENTFCKAETYFQEIQNLPGDDIYVSKVIGPYVGSNIIGPYTKARAEKQDIPFTPEEEAYAGKENPVGKRFRGLIRWAAPVVRDGEFAGWVTLALDHTHVMEFTDHILPTEERYTDISDAATGNYAFMWDDKGRCISHPRDYFIVGYDPETGEPALPWLDAPSFTAYEKSGMTVSTFLDSVPHFQDQSLERKPALEMISLRKLGLDCRVLNFAPQCTGWHNITQFGGSGSFVILWSGLWKLTTAAAIPYHTGRYAGPRGFGFVTIGANVHEFHRSATETSQTIDKMVSGFEENLELQKHSTLDSITRSLEQTAKGLTYSTMVMIALVIIIAVWMASTLTKRITSMISGIRTFQNGELSHRLDVRSHDEMGQLAAAFNEMADTLRNAVNDIKDAESKYRNIFENAVEGIFQSLPSGRFIRVNPAMAKIFGYPSPADLIEAVPDIPQQIYVSPEQREHLIQLLNKEGQVTGYEIQFRRKNGEPFWGEVSARLVRNEKGETQYIEGLVVDATERAMAREALLEAKENAEAASRMKSDFLSMVSHELRTLTAVLGFAKVIHRKLTTTVFPQLDNDPKTEKVREQLTENLQIIMHEGERLTKLINEVLDLSKLEAGKVFLELAPTDPLDILTRAMTSAEILAQEKSLDFNMAAQGPLPLVMADADRIIQVLVNLISNAVKFTAEGSITCAARQDGEFVRFSVTDTGPGIPQKELESIFDRFRQLGDVLTDRPQGSGLGLAISKEIVEHHGGRISLDSTPGQGSTFSFTVPLAG